MRDNAGERKSHDIFVFFESLGVKNYFSTAHEQWQNGLQESAINSIVTLSRTIMAESGLGGRFWFKSALAGCDARKATYKERIRTIPWKLMHGILRDVSKSVHLDVERGYTKKFLASFQTANGRRKACNMLR
jgi:hypothetical protein